MKSKRRKAAAISTAEPQLASKKLVSLDPTQTSFNIPQAAVYMGLTPWQTRMLVWQGKLLARKIGKSIIILRTDADQFLKSQPTITPSTSDWLVRRSSEVRP